MERTYTTSGTEQLWIEQASRGDMDAFNRLVISHQDMAYSHAYALLGDAAEAEDVTQEGFIKAFQALDSFRGGSFRGWLLRIITNTAYDLLRRSVIHATQPLCPVDEEGEELEPASWLSDPGMSVQETVENHELSNHIYGALNEIPEIYRSVLLLRDKSAKR